MPAPKGNQYGAKPPGQHKTNKGRIIADLGDLKNRCVKAARSRGLKLVDWLKEKLDKGAAEDGY